MLALRGVVQLLPLMRIVCVTSFGSLQSALSLEELWDAHTVDCFADFYIANFLDSFRVSRIRVHQELTPLPKS